MDEQSRRRRAEALLAGSEDVVVLQLDYDWTILFLSDPAKVFPLTGDTVGRGLWEFLPEAERTLGECLRRAAPEDPVDATVRLGTDGRWWQVRAMAAADHFTLCLRRIPEPKTIEEALRCHVALLPTILEAIPVGVWVADATGVIVASNAEARSIWNGARHVGINQFAEYKGWWRSSGKQIEGHEWAAARAILKGETSLNEEIDIQCFDGSRKTIRNAAVPLRTEDGAIYGAVIVNEDITQEKEIEEALARSWMAAEQQLLTKSRMIAALAHDLHQPLVGVRLQLTHMLGKAGNANVQGMIDTISSVERLLDDMTEMFALETGQILPMWAPVDLCHLLGMVCAEFAPQAEEKGLELRCRSVGGSTEVTTDLNLVERALRNLISNAIRYTERGGILVALRRRPSAIAIEVWDTGRGIPPDDLPHVFKEFYRGQGRSSASGYGLGLATVANIAKMLTMTVNVRSRVGRGTVFSLSFRQPRRPE